MADGSTRLGSRIFALNIGQLLDTKRPHLFDGLRWDFLTEEMRLCSGALEVDGPDSHDYDPAQTELIAACADGWVADVGAGQKNRVLPNVINVDITATSSTDVVAIAESLPFRDNSLDGVICSAVLEHVKRPWLAAAEMIRVLKPGGRAFIAVPFLQPEHGHPNHFFNMTRDGLRSLFEGGLTITRHTVPDSLAPPHTLRWMLDWWAHGLSEVGRDVFENMSVRDILALSPQQMLDQQWGRPGADMLWKLASGTVIEAVKP